MRKTLTIKCPKCGYEYLPSEIYYPDKFLGKPRNIVRNNNGEIVSYEETNMNLNEEFECYNCGCVFNVEARLNFETEVNIEHSFDDDFEIEIHKNLTNEDIKEEDNKGLW